MANKHMKMVNIINHKENENQNYNEIHLTRMALKYHENNKGWQGYGLTGTLVHGWWGYNVV